MNIILSNTAKGCYKVIVEKLKANMLLPSEHIFIVPDKLSVFFERDLIESLGLTSVSNIQVVSFTRLANKIIGKKIKKCLTPEGSVMLMTKVIQDNKDKLLYYNKVANIQGFSNELYATITSLRNSGVDASELMKKAENMTDSLKKKSMDIALIYAEYLKNLVERYSDSSTRLETLAEHIQNSSEKSNIENDFYVGNSDINIPSTHFYCLDFYSFKSPELNILKGLSNSALSLNIALVSGLANNNKRIYPDYLVSKLKNIANDKVNIETFLQPLNDAKNTIAQNLFSYHLIENKVNNDGDIQLLSAKDIYDEILFTALDILSKVRKGKRFRDFEIFAGDMQSYAPEIKSVFSRYNIPFFIDSKELLIEQTKVKYGVNVLDIATHNFRREDVFSLVKNPLFIEIIKDFGLDENDCFYFENYVLKYNINRSQFLSEFSIQDEKENSDIVQRVREILVEVVSPLLLKGNNNMSEYVKGLKSVFDRAETGWSKHIQELNDMSSYYLKCAEQVDSKIVAVLDEIEDVLKIETQLNDFKNILESMLKTLKIALVPTFLDCVFVGSMESRFIGEDDVYMLGTTNSNIPATPSVGAILSANDEELMSSFGVNITPNERQKAYSNMLAICDIMVKTQGKLTIIYPQSINGLACKPATIISEIKSFICDKDELLSVKHIDFEHILSLNTPQEQEDVLCVLFSTPRACVNEIYRQALSGCTSAMDRTLYSSAFECLSDSQKQKINSTFIVPENICLNNDAFSLATSVSRLESFYKCPYSHYLNYILKLKKRKDGNFEGFENGQILHYILEKFFAYIKNNKNLDNPILVTPNMIKNLAYTFFDRAIEELEYESFLLKADTMRMLSHLKEEAVTVCVELYEISNRSKFTPHMLEARIGEGEISPMSLSIGDNKIQLKGVIDRVDILDDKFMVIDYKTYKSVSLKLDEIYYGEKIQLYVYMKAIMNNTNLNPSGVFYMPVFSSFGNENSVRYKLAGQSINDEKVLFDMDSALIDDPKKSIVPFKKTKKGLVDIHFSREEFDMVGDYALNLASYGATLIQNGYIKPSPLEDGCSKCFFSHICAYKNEKQRKKSKINAHSFACESASASIISEGVDNE